MAYLRGFVPILLQFGDLKAAHRNGQLHVCIARKERERRRALRGCR